MAADTTDVLVAGGGIARLSASCAFGAAGFRVVCVDPVPPVICRDVMLAAQPTRRFVQIDEVAALILFLYSDEARSVTGSILPVDGGWSAQ